MSSSGQPRLFINDVSARDGFQIEQRFIPTDSKVAYIDRLSHAGLAKIEVTSFTSPRSIPALADAAEVMRRIERVRGIEYAVLVPNLRGCERALEARADEINIVMSASTAHSMANLRMTPADSLRQFAGMVAMVGDAAAINASVSTAFGCPFEGDVPANDLFDIIDRIDDLGICRVSLCDTTGMANPRQVEDIFIATRARWPEIRFTAHFHDTRAMGMANAVAALRAGIVHFDASLGGLGGCPFAPGASGNICTEDVVHMFGEMGWTTGVDLAALIAASLELPALVGHDVPGQISKAGPSSRRYPLPAGSLPAEHTPLAERAP